MNSGVYQIMNMRNYHMYIGSTKDFSERWAYHKGCLRKGTHSNIHLQRAWDKDGEELFEFSVVEFVTDSPEAWVAREQYYTDLWNPEYAIKKECVTSQLGIKRSESTKQKMSAARTGKKRKPFSDEHRQNISNSHKGQKFSDEHRRKLSTSKVGEKNNRYGIRQSEETINKRCETNKRKRCQ